MQWQVSLHNIISVSRYQLIHVNQTKLVGFVRQKNPRLQPKMGSCSTTQWLSNEHDLSKFSCANHTETCCFAVAGSGIVWFGILRVGAWWIQHCGLSNWMNLRTMQAQDQGTWGFHLYGLTYSGVSKQFLWQPKLFFLFHSACWQLFPLEMLFSWHSCCHDQSGYL